LKDKGGVVSHAWEWHGMMPSLVCMPIVRGSVKYKFRSY